MRKVIKVNKRDEQVGIGRKEKVHKTGELHRAFSVFIFNNDHELLLQKRASQKYHSAGCWSNTCCSHPGPDETIKIAAQKRLQEEMGLQSGLTYVGQTLYNLKVSEKLVEHELDHIFIGYNNHEPQINPAEVAAWRYMKPSACYEELKKYPDRFTPWFPYCFNKIQSFIKN